MANYYSEIVKANSGDSHQGNAYWLVLIVPFKHKMTYNRNLDSPGSTRTSLANPVEENDLIVIENDCVSWQTSTGKDSHASSLQMSLKHTAIGYIGKISADDWVMFWAFNSFADYKRIKEKVKNKEPANDADSGLKFIGRIQTISNALRVDPSSGKKMLGYSVSAHGFSELDSQMYFDPLIQNIRNDASLYWADFAGQENTYSTAPAGIITTQDAIPALLHVCLGMGPGEAALTGNQGPGGVTMSPNRAYQVPETVSSLLINHDPFKGNHYTYVDLLKVYIGVHEYATDSFLPNNKGSKQHITIIKDTEAANSISQSNNIYNSQTEIEDPQLLLPIYFNNQTIWSVLNTYLNEPINEMYTCLRIDENDKIVPTLMIRRIPFSSPAFLNSGGSATENQTFDVSSAKQDRKRSSRGAISRGSMSGSSTTESNGWSSQEHLSATAFLSLPRWVIDDSLIQHLEVAKNSAIRHNYVHLLPNRPGVDIRKIRAFAEPIADIADIQKSGLRGMIRQISAAWDPETNNEASALGRQFNGFMADILFDSHLKLTGTVALKGVQRPICEGDNCVVGGIIFHIERLMHSGSISADGTKRFNTTLQLSHGISTDSDDADQFVYVTNLAYLDRIGITHETE
jgi:hypothetical protein